MSFLLFLAKEVTNELSIPPESKTPTGTSAVSLSDTDIFKISWSSSTTVFSFMIKSLEEYKKFLGLQYLNFFTLSSLENI